MKEKSFKICPACGAVWETMDEFLADPTLKLNGYQVHFDDLKGGLFYFTHYIENCGITMALVASDFTSLSDRKLRAPSGCQPGGECPGSCVRKNDLSPCPIECECVWVREVVQIIKERTNATT